MRPLDFDAASEIEFVRNLEEFYLSPAGKTAIGNRSLYLLRNADTKAKGLGFAMAGWHICQRCSGRWDYRNWLRMLGQPVPDQYQPAKRAAIISATLMPSTAELMMPPA